MKWGTRCWGVELPQVVWLPLLGPAFGGVWVFGFWFLVSPSFLFGWALGASHPFGGGLPGDVSEPIKKQTSSLALLVLPRETRPLCQFPSLHRQVRWQSTAAIAISERSSFCLVECPTFHAQDLAHIRAHHPTYRAALEAYIASGGACVGSNAHGVTVLKQVVMTV